jgi:osmotically-inducible protein OsmY
LRRIAFHGTFRTPGVPTTAPEQETAIPKATAASICLAGFALALAACSPTGLALSAGTAVGVTAAQDRGIGGAAKDTRTRLEIDEGLLSESLDLFQDIHLQVQEGRVLLSGTVPNEDARLAAVRIAWRADGVREVVDEIEVAGDQSIGDYAQDRWIEAQVRAKLLTDRAVDSLNISIETVNQSVYLLGVAKSRDEIDRAVGHAKSVPYVRRVVSYVTLKGSLASGS